MIRIMVAEDNISTNRMCCKILTKDKNMQLISSTTDGESTLKEYLSLRPDVLLLDLDLPKMSGLEVINSLCEISEEKNKCNVIIISASEIPITELSNASKIYRVLKKPFDCERLLETINEIDKDDSIILSDGIRELLYALKFNLYTEGTNYLIEAVKLAYENPYLLHRTKNLYKELGKRNNIEYGRIQWGIRNSVRTMSKYVSSKELKEIFPCYDSTRNLSPKYVMILFIEYLKSHK